jgi:hypothetical protein
MIDPRFTAGVFFIILAAMTHIASDGSNQSPLVATGTPVPGTDAQTYKASDGSMQEALPVEVTGGGGGEGGPVEWVDVQNKPATFPPIVGITATTAKAGDYSPAWSEVTNKPAVMGVGATQQEAREAIGALNAALLGQPGGVAQLDPTGSVPLDQLNVSSLTFKGAWYPTTNSPELLNGTGSVGDFYKAAEDGSFNFGNGSFEFVEGDWVMFAAGVWQRLGSKETVSSVNGKMGAITLTAADVGALPDNYVPPAAGVTSFNGSSGAITYAPTWGDVTSKPNLVVKRGGMSPAIPAALLRRSTEISYPRGRQVVAWNQAVYDNFSGVSGGTYVVPEWANFARITVYIRLTVTSDDQYLYAYAVKNGVDVAMVGHPVAANTSQTAVVISPIVPVVSGDVLTGALYHNSSGSRTLVHGESGVYMQIELFEGA